MSELPYLSDDLSEADWLRGFAAICDARGFHLGLGGGHAAGFVEGRRPVLLVSFETLGAIRTTAENGLPLGFSQAAPRGWSHLSLVATGPTWFRDADIWTFFDRLIDEEFFEEFERVIFYGAGMGGYAAAAYSVAAPGAEVILISPQATLEPASAGWDDRFVEERRLDFTTRYGYAPEMIDGAARVWVIHDPGIALDAMHAALFRGPQVVRIGYRRGGAGSIDGDLRGIGVLDRMMAEAGSGTLTAQSMHRMLRRRLHHTPYLRALLARVLAEERPWLTAVLCRAALRHQPVPRFRHYLEEAEAALAREGRHLPPPRRYRSVDQDAG